MSKNEEKIEGTAENWEARRLGADEAFVAVSDVDESLVDQAVGMKMISIRLPASLIDDFKALATMHGLGYQPLMRQILERFAESEKKRLLNKVASQAAKAAEKERRSGSGACKRKIA